MNMLRITTVLLLLGTLASAPVSAVPVSTGNQRLGPLLGDFDRWELVCLGGSGARAKVTDRTDEDLPGAPNDNIAALMKVTIWEFGSGAPVSAAGEGVTSGWATTLTGSGVYSVRFEKTAASDESYSGQAECINGVQTDFGIKDDH